MIRKRVDKMDRSKMDNSVDVSAYIADGTRVAGSGITIGKDSSIWLNCVIRCDHDQTVTIGERTNVQDISMIHITPGIPVRIGNDVSIGHMCLIHGCEIGDNTLIGMGSIIMDGAKIGRDCIIGAGSLVTEGTVVPDGKMFFGRPSRYVRDLTPEEIENNREIAEGYVRLKDEWMGRKSD